MFDLDPMEYLTGQRSVQITTFNEYLDTVGLMQVFQTAIFYVGIVMALASLLSLLFARRSDAVKEKKNAVIFRLFVVFASGCAIVLFSTLKNIFDGLFIG